MMEPYDIIGVVVALPTFLIVYVMLCESEKDSYDGITGADKALAAFFAAMIALIGAVVWPLTVSIGVLVTVAERNYDDIVKLIDEVRGKE